ncbi:MAG: IPT/TIG domain-containing protein [Deltaproteobacteria bacterium]|nr:IPT/TIG domain-containing protein [Deltaproteobacteria bacterium]
MNRFLLAFLMTILAVSVMGCDKPLGVKDVTPKTGNIAGGEPITILGSGFQPGMGISVYVGNNKVDNVSVQGADKLAISTPPGNEPGPVDIRIITDSGSQFLMSKVFTYVKETGSAMDIRDLGSRKSMRKTE